MSHPDPDDAPPRDSARRFREVFGAREIKVEEVERSVSAENSRRVGRDRSWIALIIILTYGASILGFAVYVVVTAPTCPPGADACDPFSVWERQGKLLFDLVITAVLPIVTLMLGFYFGTESKGGEQPTGKA